MDNLNRIKELVRELTLEEVLALLPEYEETDEEVFDRGFNSCLGEVINKINKLKSNGN